METTSASTIGENVQRLRLERGLSVLELAKQAGVEMATVRDIEEGRSQRPKSATIGRLAAGLDVPAGALLGARAAADTVGARILQLRMAQGLGVDALGALAGLSGRAIMTIEKGMHTPRGTTLTRVAAALGVPLSELHTTTESGLVARLREGEQPIGPAAIKALAQALGGSVNDALAMGVRNDPFYIGGKADRQGAEWFAGLWTRFQFPHGVHIRRIHYRLVVHDPPILLPDGGEYENTFACFTYLNDASRYARILELVDPEAFEDRRNPPPYENTSHRPPPRVGAWASEAPSWTLPAISTELAYDLDYTIPTAYAYGYDYQPGDQPYHLEVWIEKSTMNDVLIPLCERLGVNLVTSVGFQSITAVVKLLRRVATVGKPVRIFYISDFDPAGDLMPGGVSRQLEFWRAKYTPALDIKLTNLALTREQVTVYDLPRKPMPEDKKDKDKRYKKFEALHGKGFTELDALEALHEGALAQIVRDALNQYRDRTLPGRLMGAGSAAQKVISAAWQSRTETSESELEAIKAEARPILEEYTERLEELNDELQETLAPLQERLDDVEAAVDSAAAAFNAEPHELPSRPTPEIDPPDESAWLFDAGRDYLEQLAVYQARKVGGATDDGDEDDDVA